MPTGKMTWFDPKRGEGLIESTHDYPVRVDDIEPKARVSGARVQFDVDRGDGQARAVNVTLRQGSRVSHKQRGFGNLSGAKHPEEKGSKGLIHGEKRQASPNEPHLERNPAEVAREWAKNLATGNLATVLPLYAPDATLHAGSDTYAGRTKISTYLSNVPLSVMHPLALDVEGDDDEIVLHMRRVSQQGIRFHIRNGQIVEQFMPDIAAGQ